MKPKFEDVEREIRRLAHEHPDRTAICRYAYEESPCCIVGHALAKLGVSITTLRKYDEANHSIGDSGASASDVIETDDSPDGASARRWINWVQQEQDDGYQWASCVKLADKALARGVI